MLIRPAGKRCSHESLWRRRATATAFSAGLCWLLLFLAALAGFAQAQAGTTENSAAQLFAWQGQLVRSITFTGVQPNRLDPLPGHLPQQAGQPLNSSSVEHSLRQLFATGLYDTLEVEGRQSTNGVDLIFRGTPRMFIGGTGVYGAKGPTMNAQLDRASQLTMGTRFTQSKLDRAVEQMRFILRENGFYEPTITHTLTPHPTEQLEDISFLVNSGPQARVGSIQVSGDSGLSGAEFRHYAHLHTGDHVDHDTVNHALDGVLKHFQKQNRLEAEIKLVSAQYEATADHVNYSFSVTRGPVIRVELDGASIEQDQLRHLVPIYEEGSVDDDLLNEGNRRLRDFFQRLGYFDVKVEHKRESSSANAVDIRYTVYPGPRRKVEKVSVAGNHYFDSGTLLQLLSVHAADTLDRHGAYSQGLVSADISALQTVYQNNGFANVKITPQIGTPAPRPGKAPKTAPLTVTYHIDEGPQMRVGKVEIEGNDHVPASQLTPLMNTQAGQLLSPANLAGDRDALLTAYLSRGFDHVSADVTQTPGPAGSNTVNVAFRINEGTQTFVRKVLLTGLHYTRPSTVQSAITLHAGDPLNENALLDTQRNLYEYSLFNQVDAAVENPEGQAATKTVLLRTTEARRLSLTYGFGFEAQTGQPQNNCQGAQAAGIPCSPYGKTGVSPRVLLDVTRNNLLGREQSASLRATYGLLEQNIDLLYQIPHFEGNRNLGFTFSGGYANSQDVTTYVASRLEGSLRWNQSFLAPGSFLSKANTFIYEYNFRRVKVAASSLQVNPGAIKSLSTAVRVAGPAFTWILDTRDSPMDAHRGTYTSFQEFLSTGSLGAEVQFNRIDLQNSSYYSFDKGRLVIARNTRYGQERAFGSGSQKLIPLPERMYAGGPTSLRGFSYNAAGPRDPETGYPIGGAGALINSTELRLPPPMLPWFGDTLSFVLFHDMGNVFTNAGDAWASALHVRQPHSDTCKKLATVGDSSTYEPSGPDTSTGKQGQCSFNDFSHALGIGLRYHTPVGPIRLDFSYNLNPPIFPININYGNPSAPPQVGQASHFNFFFSLGQTF